MTTKVDPELSIGRPEKESHLGTIIYEIRMLNFSRRELNNTKGPILEEQTWISLECFLLHYRNLLDVLTGNARKRTDLTITRPQQLGIELTVSQQKEIREFAERPSSNYKDDIDKYLAHCTEKRHNAPHLWFVNKMYSDILPAIDAFQSAALLARTPTEPDLVEKENANSTASMISYRLPLENG